MVCVMYLCGYRNYCPFLYFSFGIFVLYDKFCFIASHRSVQAINCNNRTLCMHANVCIESYSCRVSWGGGGGPGIPPPPNPRKKEV